MSGSFSPFKNDLVPRVNPALETAQEQRSRHAHATVACEAQAIEIRRKFNFTRLKLHNRSSLEYPEEFF